MLMLKILKKILKNYFNIFIIKNILLQKHYETRLKN